MELTEARETIDYIRDKACTEGLTKEDYFSLKICFMK